MQKSTIKTHLRNVISLVDHLRDIQLQSYIKLPKIVAVGSQSSGKSSLVQQIVGLDFLPRGNGVVTRRPLQIRMIYTAGMKVSEAVFDELPNEKFTNFALVKSTIEKLTDKLCGKNTKIVDSPIILTIYSENCPNLTIIDLPGLTRISLESQGQDVHGLTSGMIRKYISDPNTIILCVIPANQDITNDEVLHMARQIDKAGERTIGCLTKIDIMDRGTDARMTLLNKGEVPLKLGYVGIKNRSQQDITSNKTVAVSLAEEKSFFSSSPIYSSLPSSLVGTSSLVASLTTVLSSSIRQFLPDLVTMIQQRKKALEDKIKSYGAPLPKNQKESQAAIWAICSDYLKEYNKVLRGHITTLKCKAKLDSSFQNINQELHTILHDQCEQKLEDISDEQVAFAIRKYEGDNLPGFPSIHSFLYLIDPLLKDLKNPLLLCLESIYTRILHIFELILSQVTHQFVAFRQFLLGKATSILNQFRQQSATFIEDIMQCQTNYIYTNSDYFDNLMHEPLPICESKLLQKFPMIPLLRQKVNAYYKVAVKHLKDIIPQNIKYLLMHKAGKQLQFDLLQSCMGKEQQMTAWLKLDQGAMKQRLLHEKQFDTLNKADKFLKTNPELAALRAKNIVISREKRQAEIKQNGRKNQDNSFSPIGKEEILRVVPNDSSKKTTLEKDVLETIKIIPTDTKNTHSLQKPGKTVPTQPSPSEGASTDKAEQIKNLFGIATVSPKDSRQNPLLQQQKPNEVVKPKQIYNREMGKATDKAVDNMFANQTFKKESTRAVQNGTALAAQKQFGMSEDNAHLLGRGAGWLFKQDAVQDRLKEEAKKKAKQQTQINK